MNVNALANEAANNKRVNKLPCHSCFITADIIKSVQNQTQRKPRMNAAAWKLHLILNGYKRPKQTSRSIQRMTLY